MKFLLDHDVPAEVGRVLGQAAHDVVLVKDVMAPTASDEAVLEWAVHNARVLVTCNRDDFLALSTHRQHAGLIVLIRRRTRIAECAAILRLLEKAGETGIDGNINFA